MGPQLRASGSSPVFGCSLQFDRKHHVLLITYGKVATPASALTAYDSVEHFVSSEGPCSVLADLSNIETVDVPGDFIRSLAWMPTVLPSELQRVVVAPRGDVYGLSRMFQLYRDKISSEVHVVRTLEEAYSLLGVESPAFERVDLT